MKHFHPILYLLIVGCTTLPGYEPDRQFQNLEKELVTQFILAEDSAVITLPAGHFSLSKGLILEGRSHVTIEGAGLDETVLSFKGQNQGAEGIRIANCKNIILRNFSIEDSPGDNIKITDTDGITLERIKSGWTGIISEKNGAYALYPVLCTRVVIKNCEAFGASDAGVYVGQSDTVLIEGNKAYWNVAGIESENSTVVIIKDNEAFENTGGILVFDLPGLTQTGKNVKVLNNKIYENNTQNFAPVGNIVGIIPPGTGLLILATREVEVYENEIRNNRTFPVGIVSYDLASAISTTDTTIAPTPGYDPYPGQVSLTNNTYSNDYLLPDLGNDFGKLLAYKFQLDRPEIYWDGIKAPSYYLPNGAINPKYQICINEGSDVVSVNISAETEFAAIEVDPDYFNCN